MKFAKYLAFLFLLCFLPARATIRDFCFTGGCTYLTPILAVNAAAAGDTVEGRAGPHNYAVASLLDFSAKARILFRSTTSDTLMGDNQVIKGGDSLTVNNFVISWTADTAAASGRLFEANGKKKIWFNYCAFRANGQRAGGQKAFGRFIGTGGASSSSDNHQFIKCVWDSCDWQDDKDFLSNHVRFDSCTLNAARINLGNMSHIRYCKIRQGATSGSEPISVYGSNDSIEYNFLHCGGLSGECFSSDDAPDSSQSNMVVRYINTDSSTHVHFIVDHFKNSIISNITVHYHASGGNFGPGAFYVHDNVATDTLNNVKFSQITFTGSNGTTSPVMTRAVVSNFGGHNVAWFNSVFQGTSGTMQAALSGDSLHQDSIYRCLFRGTTPVNMNTWDYVGADTLRGVDPVFIQPSIDTVVRPYPYLKYRAVAVRSAIQAGGVYYGNKKHLVNPGAATSITTTGFSVRDSVADDFWWDLPWEKDTLATLKIQTSTDGVVWTDRGTKVNRRAGAIDTFAVTGLAPSTKVKFRLIGVGTPRTGAVADTTLSSASVAFIDSATTSSSSTGGKISPIHIGIGIGF